MLVEAGLPGLVEQPFRDVYKYAVELVQFDGLTGSSAFNGYISAKVFLHAGERIIEEDPGKMILYVMESCLTTYPLAQTGSRRDLPAPPKSARLVNFQRGLAVSS